VGKTARNQKIKKGLRERVTNFDQLSDQRQVDGQVRREDRIMRIKSASQKGAAMVEFALILIPLLLITFGIIEFGLLMYNQQVLTNASREGARAGIVASNPRVTPAAINSVVQNYCLNHLVTFGNLNIPTINPNPPTGYSSNATFGTNLTVQVNYSYSFLVIPNFIPGITNPHPMHAMTVMKYE
jgi:Flp pilus assembly protein TadG